MNYFAIKDDLNCCIFFGMLDSISFMFVHIRLI